MSNPMKTVACLCMSILVAFAGTYYFIMEGGVVNPEQVPNAPSPPPPGDVELIEIESDSVPIPPTGFLPTTESEIHAKGLQTPSESFAAAQLQGNVAESNPERGFYAYSWVNFMYVGDFFKRAACGSKTSRSFYAPGNLALKCQTKENGGVVNRLPSSFPSFYQTWGYSTTHTWNRHYWKYQTRTYNQHGWHHWGNPATGTETDITRTW